MQKRPLDVHVLIAEYVLLGSVTWLLGTVAGLVPIGELARRAHGTVLAYE